MTDDIGPLLSSVSLMLAAFGFFYTTQRERIDKAIDDTTVPAPPQARADKRTKVARVRREAGVLAAAAFVVWLLLLPEIIDRFPVEIDVDKYSTPHVIFFVAANAWLLVALYVFSRWLKLRDRVTALNPG